MRTFKKIIRKHILVGITGFDNNGKKIYEFELHGPVVYARRGDKISFKVESNPVPSQLTLNSDNIYSIPPDLSRIEAAPEGVYTLKSTGESVVNPDLLASWSVTAP